MKVSELKDEKLDYWVAKARGYVAYVAPAGCILGTEENPTCLYQPSKDWSQGGPIIERERIATRPSIPKYASWTASMHEDYLDWKRGKTLLIAAMRCYVASKFGDEVDDS